MLAALLSNCLPVRPGYVEAKILRRVRDAYAHVPFYRALLDERGLGAGDFASLALRKGEGDYQVNYRSVFFALSDPRTEAGISTGEIAVTSLHSAAAPILMMELGDVVSCRNYDRLFSLGTSISAIAGRADEYALGRDGEKVYAVTFYSLFTQEPAVRQFRVLQERAGECDMFVLAEAGADRSGLEARIGRHLQGRLTPRFHYVDRIPFEDKGKVSIVINRLAQASPHN